MHLASVRRPEPDSMPRVQDLRGFLAFPMAAALLAAAAQGASAASTGWTGDKRAEVRLITAADGIAGETLQAGLQFRYAEGWHGYWRTPGDAGIAPVFDWTASRNVKAASVAWPAPKRLVAAGLQNAIYDGLFVLPIDLRLAEPAAATRISLAVDYAACGAVCVPLHADLSLALPAGPDSPSLEAPAIAAALGTVPGLPSAAGIEIQHSVLKIDGAEAVLTLRLRSLQGRFHRPDLFVEGAGSGLPPAPTVRLGDDGTTATLTGPLPGAVAGAPLTITLVDGDRSAEFQVGR